MNQYTNFEIVYNFGDYAQMKYGNQFGYYAKELTKDKITKFCNEVNFYPLSQNNNYYLTTKQTSTNDNYILTLINNQKCLSVPVMLLDHCIYIDASAEDWVKIDQKFFNLIQRLWIEFLSKSILGYRNHYKKTILLSQLDDAYSY